MTTTPTPAEPLKPYGYAPGNYTKKCLFCDSIMRDVDKSATHCRYCAEEKRATSAAAAAPIPFKPETWPVDADGDTPTLCTVCGTPVRYGSRHTKCAPGWKAPEIAQPATPAEANPWRQAVDRELVNAGLDCLAPDAEATPSLARLLSWRCTIALDPAVSEEAQALIERGRASAPSAQVVEPPPHDHEKFDAIAAARYKVVPNTSGFWGHAVVVGDSTAQVYKGHKRDCDLVARRMAGAFLDGAFLASKASALQAAIPAQQPRLWFLTDADDIDGDDPRSDVALQSWQAAHDAFNSIGTRGFSEWCERVRLAVAELLKSPLASPTAQPATSQQAAPSAFPVELEQPEQPKDLGVSPSGPRSPSQAPPIADAAFDVLHVFAQHSWHAEAYIGGTAGALRSVMEAIHKALRTGVGTVEAFTNDGEGYELHITRMSDEDADRMPTPYTAEYASAGDGPHFGPWALLREGSIVAEGDGDEGSTPKAQEPGPLADAPNQ